MQTNAPNLLDAGNENDRTTAALWLVAKCALAFASCWLAYMIIMVMTVYDGLPSLIFQPLIAAILSAGAVLISLIAGAPLHFYPLKDLWRRTGWFAAPTLWLSSIFIILNADSFGLLILVTDPVTDETFRTFENGFLMIAVYLNTVFPIVNLPAPSRARRRDAPNAVHSEQG